MKWELEEPAQNRKVEAELGTGPDFLSYYKTKLSKAVCP
jgi:hypothetical protein